MSGRTLVISDLHIGARDGCSVLEHPAALDVLLTELERCERLVLLGDLVELQEAQATRAFAVLAPILAAIGARLGPDREVLYLPGNHDRQLIRGWLRAQGRSLATEAVVPPNASAPLQQMLAQLAPARVEIRYPAVWLSERVWAHHGHHLNRYLVPDQSYGLMLGRHDQPPPGQYLAADFERRQARGGGIRSLVRLLPRLAAAGVEEVEEVMRAATMPAPSRPADEPLPNPPIEMTETFTDRLHERIIHPSMSPLVSHLLGLQVRRHSIPAVARVAHDLGRAPEFLLFGHVHRRGPMDGDNLGEWRRGETRVLNTGSWRWESVLVERAQPPHPYWPGGAIVIDGDGEPRSVGLLDHLSRAELLGQGVPGTRSRATNG